MGGKGREGNWGGSSCLRSAKCIEVEVKQLNSRLKKNYMKNCKTYKVDASILWNQLKVRYFNFIIYIDSMNYYEV